MPVQVINENGERLTLTKPPTIAPETRDDAKALINRLLDMQNKAELFDLRRGLTDNQSKSDRIRLLNGLKDDAAYIGEWSRLYAELLGSVEP